MEFKAAKCPSCGGDLQLPIDKDKVKCMYCGGDISVKETLQAAAKIVNTASLKDIGMTAYESKDYKKAVAYFDKVLEANSKDAEALFYRGMAGLRGLHTISVPAGLGLSISEFLDPFKMWGLLDNSEEF